MKKNHETNKQQQGGPLVSMCSKQVRSQGVPREYPDEWLELRWIRASQTSPIPLHVKVRGKSVKEVAVENPWSRGGHTHTHIYIHVQVRARHRI